MKRLVLIRWRKKGMFPRQKKRRHHHLLLQLCVRPLSRAIFNRTVVSFVNACSLFCVKRIAEALYSPEHMFKLRLMVRVIINVLSSSVFPPVVLHSWTQPTNIRLFKCAGSVGISLYICSWGWTCLFGLELFIFRFVIHLPFGHVWTYNLDIDFFNFPTPCPCPCFTWSRLSVCPMAGSN